MKRLYLIMCTAAIALSSCGTYKTYTRPNDVKTDSLFGTGNAAPLPTGEGQEEGPSLASLPWRELFTDSKLQSLIETGLANNSDLRLASLRVAEAEASLKAAKLAYLPAASITPQGQLTNFDGNGSQTYNLALSADWELDIAGRITNTKRGAVATLAMQHAARQAVQTQLVATIANSYYNLLMLDSQLDISQRTLKSWEETLRTLEVMKKVGESTEAAVAQARANKMTVEGSIVTLGQQIREQENTLSVLLGLTPRHIDRTTLTEQSFPDSLSVGVPLQLLDNRPDVRQAEYSLQSAYYATQVARATFYPQVTLSGTFGWTNNSGAAIVNPGKWLANAIGSLTQPLFNKGRTVANLEIAKAQQEEAKVSFQQKLLQAGAEVNNALSQWQSAQKRLDIDSKQVTALRDAVRSTRLLLQHSSSASYLEVLTAQQTLLQSELTEVQDKFNKIQSIIRLYHAVGGGN